MALSDHNKIIANAAKQKLSPMGLERYGKSRTWIDDHGYWCIVVEFQPSSFSKGTYLNVGVSWLLFEKAHWTFDIGHREREFTPAGIETQFSEEILDIASQAARSVSKYREQFEGVQATHRYYQSTELRSRWEYYYAGVAALAGDISSARRNFEYLLSQPAAHQAEKGLFYRVLDLNGIIDDRRAFLDYMTGVVYRTRSLLGLSDRESSKLSLT